MQHVCLTFRQTVYVFLVRWQHLRSKYASVTINNCIFCLLANILYKFAFSAAGKVIGGIITVKARKFYCHFFVNTRLIIRNQFGAHWIQIRAYRTYL